MFIHSLIMVEYSLDTKHYSRHWDRDNKSCNCLNAFTSQLKIIQCLIHVYNIQDTEKFFAPI